MKVLKKIIRSKYQLTLIVFGIWIAFFDENNLVDQIKRQHNLNSLQESEKILGQKIADTQKELENLQNDPAAIEKYAREKYLMKKANEDLFIVETVRGK